MTQITINDNTLLLVDRIPENAIIDPVVKNRQVSYMYRDKQGCMNYAATGIPLFPPGSWELLGKADAISEEVACELGIAGWKFLFDAYNINPSTTIILKLKK